MPIDVSGFDHLARQMLKTYEAAELRMLKQISKHAAGGMNTKSWASRKYTEMHTVSKELRNTVRALKSDRTKMADEFIRTAYRSSAGAFVSEARAFTNVVGISSVSPNSQKAAAILLDLNRSLDAADRLILRRANDAYADIIGRASVLVSTGTITLRDAVKIELDELAKKGITSFVDKNGRAWEMPTYAEMATLTAIERATRAGYIDTMKSYGFDLAMISSHAGACPLCVAWEGVVVSVSGNNPDYPSLGEAESDGVFHPRCMHYLSTYYEGVSGQARTAPREVEPPSKQYSTRQRQRAYERLIRQWKRRMAVATDPYDERVCYARVRLNQKKLRNLIRNAQDQKLPRKYWREGGIVRLRDDAKKLKPITLK